MEESPRKVYVNSPIFTEEDAQLFQYVNPEVDLEDEQAAEEPTSRVIRRQRPHDYDKQQPSNDKKRDENDRDPLTLFRSSEWQFVVRKPDEKETRKVVRNDRSGQTHDDEAAERLEIEQRTQSLRDEATRNNIPNLELVDSEDDAIPADSLDLEISDGNHAANFKHPVKKPLKKMEVLRDSLEEGDQDDRDDREVDAESCDSREESKVRDENRNGYYLHKDGSNHHQNGYYLHEESSQHRKPITALNGATKPTQNVSYQHAPIRNQKASLVHQHQQQNWNASSRRSDADPPSNVFIQGGARLSSVHKKSREHEFTVPSYRPHDPQHDLHFRQNEPHNAKNITYISRPQMQLADNSDSVEMENNGGNQFSRGLATRKPDVSSHPEKNFVEGNKQLVTKPPKMKKTYGEIYFRKKSQENPNTALPPYPITDRRKVFSADNINSFKSSYDTGNHMVEEERNSYRGRDGKAAEDLWRSRAENLVKRKSSGQGGKPFAPSGLRKYPSESKMDLRRLDQNEARSKAIYGGGGGGSAPYLSRHPPYHLNPIEQQQQLLLHQQQQQQQQQHQQQWVSAAHHALPNNANVHDAAHQQLQHLQQHQLLQTQLQQQYQQQLPQQQLQQVQEQQQQQLLQKQLQQQYQQQFFPQQQQIQEQQQQQLFQQIQKQQLHKEQLRQQHQQLQQQQLQQQQVQQQLQQQQLQQQQLQKQQFQQQQLQQQHLQQQQLQQEQLQQQQLQQQHLYQHQFQQQAAKQQELQQQMHMQQPLPMQQLKQQPLQLQQQQVLLQQANPVYGGTGDPVHHIITTEDGRKVSVDINLKVLKPASQDSNTFPIQPGFQTQHFPAQPQMPLSGGYTATVFHPVTGPAFQEVSQGSPYATISVPVLNAGSHQVNVGQQYLYNQLPQENHPKVMSQPGLPQSFGNVLPVSATAEQSNQHLPPKTKHPLSPFRILPPVVQPQSKNDKRQKNVGQMVPPLKFHDQMTVGNGLNEVGRGGGGGYMEQYQKHRNKQQDYKQYTLDDYRKLQKEAKLSNLGSLGPDVENDYHREKKEKATRQQEYARQIKERNRIELEQQRQKQSDLFSPASVNEQSEVKAKRAIALDYAKKVPKPQTVVRSADNKHVPTVASGGKKQGFRNSQLPQSRHHPREEEELWRQPPQPTTADLDIDFDELQKLRQRHELERQRLELLLQNA